MIIYIPFPNKAWFPSGSVHILSCEPFGRGSMIPETTRVLAKSSAYNPWQSFRAVQPVPLDEIRDIQKEAIIFIYYLCGKFSKQACCFFEVFLIDSHRRCQDSWTFIFQPPKQHLSEWLLKFLRSFLGIWGENGKKLWSDRRWKGSCTRKICPEAGKVQSGFKRVLARTESCCLPAKVSSEQRAMCPRFLAFCLLSGKCEQMLPKLGIWPPPALGLLLGVFS